jgi:hypothetical protein
MVNPSVIICILLMKLIRWKITFIYMLPTEWTDSNFIGIICNYFKKLKWTIQFKKLKQNKNKIKSKFVLLIFLKIIKHNLSI